MIIMKKYGNIDINMMTKEQREEYLSALVLQLKKFKSSSGSEGTAYFVGNNLVVKEYVKTTGFHSKNLYIDSIFDLYCQEIQNFAKQGYLVPEIYSWIKYIPKSGVFSKNIEPRYYILEEKINGRGLYLPSLHDCYLLFEDECSIKKFEKVIKNPNENLSLCKEIIRTYISDYIYANEIVASMSDADLDAFVTTISSMFEQAEYGLPDVHASNVMISENKLKLIDNYMMVKQESTYFNSQTVEEFLLARFLILFRSNEKVAEFGLKNKLVYFDDSSDLRSLMDKNLLLCEAALEKIFKSMKRCLDGKTVQNQRVLHTAYQRLARLLDYDKAGKLIHIVNERYL